MKKIIDLEAFDRTYLNHFSDACMIKYLIHF